MATKRKNKTKTKQKNKKQNKTKKNDITSKIGFNTKVCVSLCEKGGTDKPQKLIITMS